MKLGFYVHLNKDWTEAVDALVARLGDAVQIARGPEECMAQADSLDAVVANLTEPGFYERARNLKALFVPFVGINHLPIALLQERGIAVHNCHGNAFSVAERALALTLAGFGRVVEYHNDLKLGRWHGFWAGKGSEDFWRSLHGKTCAILGTGAIGKELAGLLKAFKCTVRGFKRRPGIVDLPHFDAVTTDLREAVSGADVVYVTMPLTSATKGLLGEKELSWMKGAWLVNVGRGEIADEEALYKALLFGTLAGAAIDVWYKYPKDGDHGHPSSFPLDELQNVVLSPHVGGSTKEAAAENIKQSCENLALYVISGKAEHRVDLRELY
jgi:phosphoglycerate dehydrogenase-like enzyme